MLVPADLTLYGLHRVIQIAFGWEGHHLHAFRSHSRRYGTMEIDQRERPARVFLAISVLGDIGAIDRQGLNRFSGGYVDGTPPLSRDLLH